MKPSEIGHLLRQRLLAWWSAWRHRRRNRRVEREIDTLLRGLTREELDSILNYLESDRSDRSMVRGRAAKVLLVVLRLSEARR